MNLRSSVLACPSWGGAAIWTPTPSLATPAPKDKHNQIVNASHHLQRIYYIYPFFQLLSTLRPFVFDSVKWECFVTTSWYLFCFIRPFCATATHLFAVMKYFFFGYGCNYRFATHQININVNCWIITIWLMSHISLH